MTVGVQADRLYVGDTLVWDGTTSGQEDIEVTFSVAPGVGELELAPMAVTHITGDAPVRLRLHSTSEGRDADLGRSIYAPYPGGRCLALEVNAPRPHMAPWLPVSMSGGSWQYDIRAFAPAIVFWSADAPATITLTGRLL